MRDNSLANKRSHLLGIGLDNEDGHKRITQAEQFSIVGGSQDTHDRMTETVVKTFEDMKKAGKRLETIEHKHLAELIDKNRPSD